MSALMRRGQILCCRGFNDPRLQSKALRQRDPRLGLEAVEHCLLINDASRDLIIAMFSIAKGENAPVGDLFPELNVVERIQPGFHIFDVFKNNHVISVPQH